MTDYRKLEEVHQIGIQRALMVEGQYSKLGELVEAGEICAICWEPEHICPCNHED